MSAVHVGRAGFVLLLVPLLNDCESCKPAHQTETTCFVHEAAPVSGAACPASKDTEPNDRLSLAQYAGALDCTERTLVGTLAPNDVDVHRLTGTICSGSHLAASWSLPGAKLCMFAGCNHGLMNFANCAPDKGSPVRFGEGILGCCIEGPGSVELISNCGPLETELHAWIVVERSGSDQCEDYEIHFHD